ncbi:40S ribosomal protein S30 [Armadillidium vulgare]|nr:40S ribosomal protein S30 [Armadillidium vulgare]
MQLYIRSQNIHNFEFNESAVVADVKKYICHNENFRRIRGILLEDDTCLTNIGSTEIDVNVALKGGKVHGSLSRAGKVKGQTPKVEKKEKKKSKTGRAKRRIQYNRRFVNVVQTFGKKRGPNSNS